MRSYTEQMNLDWYRQKTVDIKKRGNLSILLPQNGAAVSRGEKNPGKPRCIWPSVLNNADSRFISRRVWSR